ncbi:MAG: polysaccharide deacetylase family protein [Bacteroidales bacterium]|nr:polysaccharide deacetylase family protein [Bacteroidales bacterium]
MAKPVLIYSQKFTPRLEYVLDFVFNSVLGLPYKKTEIINNPDKSVPLINYSDKEVPGSFFIFPAGLVYESGIKNLKPNLSDWEGIPVLFPTTNNADIPFDVFSAVFYLLSRYEEYLPFNQDSFSRFEAGRSFAKQNHFLNKPVVDLWILKLKDQLLKRFPNLKFAERKFKHIHTVDIDQAWAYKHKGIFRNFGRLAKALFQFNFKEIKTMIRVLNNLEPDPFFNFEYLQTQEKKFNYRSIYFFLLGNYTKPDTNISYRNKYFRDLIKTIAGYAEVGIHPSFHSNNKQYLLKSEIARLEEIINIQVHKSRQHYLMVRLPLTYINLIKHGIIQDFSLGFAQLPGFRAGTCTPFKFYNLISEETSGLELVPFQVMDVTLQKYMNLNPEQAIKIIKDLVDEIKRVNGTFVSLWHNESLSDSGNWKGWRKVHEEMLKHIYG